jgi:protein kinase C substrate 80K-H
VCPYGSAKQKEGHSSTSLGSWSGFDDVDRTHLKFTGGQTCWQGPQRSLTVKLRCGEADTLLTVDEPSKCVYEMTMQTPAVCQEAHVHAIRQTLEGKPVHEHDEL